MLERQREEEGRRRAVKGGACFSSLFIISIISHRKYQEVRVNSLMAWEGI